MVNTIKIMKPDIKSYLNSWSDEIDSRKNRIRHLIGDAHWLSDGHHKESILKEFLIRYLPNDLNIGRGFIKTTRDLTLCSPEVDILVSDPKLNPPFLFEGDLQIIDSSAVLAQIEVKTTFNKSTLIDALKNISRTQSIIGDFKETSPVWKGISFFTNGTNSSLEKLVIMIEAAIQKALKNEQVAVVPVCIMVLDHYCCFLDQTSSNEALIKLFDLGTLSFPCAFVDMFSAMRRRYGGSVLGGLDNVIESLDIAKPIIRKITF